MDTNKKIGIVIILLMSCLSFIIGVSTLYANNLENELSVSNSRTDIRFVLDMSLDMKKNDPDRSRIREIQKIIKSLPDNAVSGVWTYGKYVNMLVPLGPTTNEWKKQAVYKLDTIDGYGDFRNLGEAIEKATYGWQHKSAFNKYLIVLTGGDLRVSKSKVENAKSQLHLLTKTLAKLKHGNIKIHALSFGKKADDRLLKVLASNTKGNWYKISSSDTLSKVINYAYNVIAAKNNSTSVAAKYTEATIAKKEELQTKTIEINSKLVDHHVQKNIANKKVANNENSNIKPESKYSFNSLSKKSHLENNINNLHQTSREATDSNKKIHGKPTKLKAVQQQKKLNLEYKNRKDMDFNWPETYSG